MPFISIFFENWEVIEAILDGTITIENLQTLSSPSLRELMKYADEEKSSFAVLLIQITLYLRGEWTLLNDVKYFVGKYIKIYDEIWPEDRAKDLLYDWIEENNIDTTNFPVSYFLYQQINPIYVPLMNKKWALIKSFLDADPRNAKIIERFVVEAGYQIPDSYLRQWGLEYLGSLKYRSLFKAEQVGLEDDIRRSLNL